MIAILSDNIVKTLEWAKTTYKINKVLRGRFLISYDRDEYVIIQNKEQALGLMLDEIIKAPDYVSLEEYCAARVRNYSSTF